MEMKYISMLLGSFLLVAAGCNSEKAVDSEETHIEATEVEASSPEEAVQPVETAQEKPTYEDQISEETEPIEDIKVHFIDAGQADATLFEYSEGDEDYAVLFDAGDWNQDDVVHYLNTEGIENIDVMMLSHPHADHIGQADRIIEDFSVEEVFMSGEIQTSQTFERVIDAIDYYDVGYEESRAGDIYDVGPLQIEMINPENLDSDENNNSLAARFQYGDDFSVMLTGDVEEATEAQIVRPRIYIGNGYFTTGSSWIRHVQFLHFYR
ncbi:MBL fold metallo-hydrolase [Sinobaca sp. H24]|uniref:MBL fold metallo-hydrolase n=1 Tax=Sinobaca sp. H24 TaxID=2923376 RepID=UPI00207A0193|nr:MBL fold metallo-hydrolase [Sinobaca sp. H24]